jgi:hypothetical protein
VATSKCRRRWLGTGIDAAGAAGAARDANLFFGCTASPAKRHKPHRFPAQLCEQDFDAYECSVISDDTMQAVGAGILDESSSPRSPEPRR